MLPTFSQTSAGADAFIRESVVKVGIRAQLRISRSLNRLVAQRRHSSMCRHFVPCATVQNSPSSLLVPTAPLFEKERNSLTLTLFLNFDHPFRIHRSGARPRFTSDNYPIDSIKIELAKGSQQGFQR